MRMCRGKCLQAFVATFFGLHAPVGIAVAQQAAFDISPDSITTSESAFEPQATPALEDSETQPSDDRIKKLVDEYLARHDEKTVDAKDAAEKTAEEKKEGSGKDLGMTAKWHHGLELESKDKHFRVHVGGRYQFDTSWFSVDQAVQQNIAVPYGDGVDFRRARLRIDGTLYESIDWAAEYDFVNSFRAGNIANNGFVENATIGVTDLWWQYRNLPWFGTVKVGQQKEPIGFEHIVSSRFQPFMERSFNQDTFNGGTFNGFSPGISALRNFGQHDAGLIHYGLFKPVNNISGFNTGDGDYSAVVRLTRLLWYADEGRSLLHFGASGRQASATGQAGTEGRVQTYRSRDAIRAGLSQSWPVPAGINLFGDDTQWVNSELVAVRGPWTLQSEYLVSGLQDARATLAGPVVGNATYHGGYVQLLYFLTGESDQYNKKTGAFDRVIPHENFHMSPCCHGGTLTGIGAWQIGARYNYLDLNDKGLNGGILHSLVGGLNWFMNPNMKSQLNYMATYRDVSQTDSFPNGSGWIHGFGTRIAFDF